MVYLQKLKIQFLFILLEKIYMLEIIELLELLSEYYSLKANDYGRRKSNHYSNKKSYK